MFFFKTFIVPTFPLPSLDGVIVPKLTAPPSESVSEIGDHVTVETTSSVAALTSSNKYGRKTKEKIEKNNIKTEALSPHLAVLFCIFSLIYLPLLFYIFSPERRVVFFLN